jgi:hypothetical protein
MATRYWVSGGTTTNWSDTSNWAATSGGTRGVSVPGSADTVFFNAASGSGTATVDSNVTIQTLTMTGFTGTLAFGTNIISLNSTGTVFTGAATHSVTGTPVIIVTNTSATATTVSTGAVTEANSISFKFIGGTYALIFLPTFRSVDFTGFSGNWSQGATAYTIYGNVTLSSTMTATGGAGGTTFAASSGVQTITSNGFSWPIPLIQGNSGATLRLVDSLITTTYQYLHNSGTLDLNGKTLTVGTNYTTGTGTKNITFNGGTLVCPNGFNNAAPSGFTTTAGTGIGKISMTRAIAQTFAGGGSTFNCTLSNDAAGALTISGSSTFTTIANGVQPTTITFTSGTTQTITDWNLGGISGSLVTIRSSVAGTAATISKASGTVNAYSVSLQDIAATGGASWYVPYSYGSVNVSGNSGWVFGVAKYWVGGTGNWSTAARWATSSGGAGGAGITFVDGAFFDSLSGGGIATIDSNITAQTLTTSGYTGTLAFGTNTISLAASGAVFTGSSSHSVSGTPVINITNSTAAATTVSTGIATEANSISFNFTGGTYALTLATNGVFRHLNFTGFAGSLGAATSATIYGDLTLSSTVTVSTASTWAFASTSATTRVITTNATTIGRPINFTGVGGSWRLADALLMGATRTLTHTNGTIDLNGKTLTVGTRYTTATGTKNLTFNGGTLVCPDPNTTSFNNAAPTNFSTTAGTGTGKISMTAATAKTFVGGGSTFNCTLSNDGAGALTISGANTFTTIANGVQPTAFVFPISTTQTLTNWNVSGTAGNLVTITSGTAGTAASLSKSSGTVSADYLSLKDSAATGGATWYAGANSTNVSGNSGWIFSNAPSNAAGSFFFMF